MLGEILDDLLISASTGPCITATRYFPARDAVYAPFPSTMDPRIVDALRARGIEQLYSHQATAWDLVHAGRHVVVVTPTASGKTLCYNLPVLQALVHQPDARALYLFPTKALAQDQLAELEQLAKQLPEMRMFTYDGDTPQDVVTIDHQHAGESIGQAPGFSLEATGNRRQRALRIGACHRREVTCPTAIASDEVDECERQILGHPPVLRVFVIETMKRPVALGLGVVMQGETRRPVFAGRRVVAEGGKGARLHRCGRHQIRRQVAGVAAGT